MIPTPFPGAHVPPSVRVASHRSVSLGAMMVAQSFHPAPGRSVDAAREDLAALERGHEISPPR